MHRLQPLAPCPWQRDDPEWANGARWWIVPADWDDRPFPGRGFASLAEAREHALAQGLLLEEVN